MECGLCPAIFNGKQAAKSARKHFLKFHAQGRKQVRGPTPRWRKRRCQATETIDAIVVSDEEDAPKCEILDASVVDIPTGLNKRKRSQIDDMDVPTVSVSASEMIVSADGENDGNILRRIIADMEEKGIGDLLMNDGAQRSPVLTEEHAPWILTLGDELSVPTLGDVGLPTTMKVSRATSPVGKDFKDAAASPLTGMSNVLTVNRAASPFVRNLKDVSSSAMFQANNFESVTLPDLVDITMWASRLLNFPNLGTFVADVQRKAPGCSIADAECIYYCTRPEARRPTQAAAVFRTTTTPAIEPLVETSPAAEWSDVSSSASDGDSEDEYQPTAVNSTETQSDDSSPAEEYTLSSSSDVEE